MARRALFVSSVAWNGPFQVGNHHLARRFVADGWRVAFVSTPISPLHFFTERTPDFNRRLKLYRDGGTWDEQGRLWAYVPGALLAPKNAPFLKSRWLHRNWRRLAFPDMPRLLKEKGFGEVDFIHIHDARQAFWLDVLPHKASAYRMADNDFAFGGCAPAMAEMIADVVQRVDLTLYTAKTLKDVAARLNPRRMLHLPNGVDTALFVDAHHQPRPSEYEGIAGPIAIYVGSFNERFDFPLLAALAAARPHITFVIIGPPNEESLAFPPMPNVRFLGTRPHAALPAYLGHADVGIIPFDVRRFGEQVNYVNPLKLYEYMAAGLPVVTSSWEELERLGSPAHLCKAPGDFTAALDTALASDESARETGRRFAGEQDWESRYRTLIAALGMGAA